jgi:hypothetical protein
MAQLALRFVLSNPDVATVIPGTRTLDYLADNLAAADTGLLPAASLPRSARIAGTGPSPACHRRRQGCLHHPLPPDPHRALRPGSSTGCDLYGMSGGVCPVTRCACAHDWWPCRSDESHERRARITPGANAIRDGEAVAPRRADGSR